MDDVGNDSGDLTMTYRNDLDAGQYLTFIIAIVLSSFLSLFGSISIIYLVWNKLNKVYHRTLLAISLVDFCLSVTNMIHLIMAPSDKSSNPYVIGNDLTCAAMGFVLNSAMVLISVYNAFLSINFLLQIRYRWTDAQVGKYIEKIVHIGTISLSFALPSLAISWQVMSPELMSGLCLMMEYPNGCDVDETIECVNGEGIGGLLAISAAGVIYLVAIIGFACTFALYWTVRSTIRKSGQFDFAQELDTRQKERLRRVSWQCTMYGLAYLNTVIWPAIHQIVGGMVEGIYDRLGDPGPFALLLMPFFFFPLQGFFNFLVFITPRYQSWRRALPEEPWQYVLRCAMSRDDPPTRQSTNNFGSTFISRRDGKKSVLQRISQQLVSRHSVNNDGSTTTSTPQTSQRSISTAKATRDAQGCNQLSTLDEGRRMEPIDENEPASDSPTEGEDET